MYRENTRILKLLYSAMIMLCIVFLISCESVTITSTATNTVVYDGTSASASEGNSTDLEVPEDNQENTDISYKLKGSSELTEFDNGIVGIAENLRHEILNIGDSLHILLQKEILPELYADAEMRLPTKGIPETLFGTVIQVFILDIASNEDKEHNETILIGTEELHYWTALHTIESYIVTVEENS